MGEKPIRLEITHIKWHQYDSPAKVSNSLALCAIHHELFDAGAFTISPDVYKVSVFTLFSGEAMMKCWDALTLILFVSCRVRNKITQTNSIWSGTSIIFTVETLQTCFSRTFGVKKYD